jgi:hypothetical protein
LFRFHAETAREGMIALSVRSRNALVSSSNPLASSYEQGGELIFFPIDRHPNELGTAIAAGEIARFLQERFE